MKRPKATTAVCESGCTVFEHGLANPDAEDAVYDRRGMAMPIGQCKVPSYYHRGNEHKYFV